MKRKECRACNSSNLNLFLDLGKMPVAGGFLTGSTDSIENEKTYPLQIHVCQESFMENMCFQKSFLKNMCFL